MTVLVYPHGRLSNPSSHRFFHSLSLFAPHHFDLAPNLHLLLISSRSTSPPATFAIITLKGPKGSIELDETQTVADLYAATKNIVGWTDAEDDYYVLIVSGKKLVALDATLVSALPNSKAPKVQVIVTKLSKPAQKSTPAAADASTQPSTMNDSTTPASAEARQAETKTATATPQPTPTPATPSTPQQPATPVAKSTTPATTQSPPAANATSASSPTTTSTDASTIDYAHFPRDLDFLPLLHSRDNIARFLEYLEETNPDVAQEIAKSPATFMMAVETFTRAAHNDEFNAQQHITAMEQTYSRRVAGQADPLAAAATRPALAQAQQAQRAQQTNQLAAQLNDAEKAQVQELVNLGFTYNKALQAYIICDKNAEYAANYLFEHMD